MLIEISIVLVPFMLFTFASFHMFFRFWFLIFGRFLWDCIIWVSMTRGHDVIHFNPTRYCDFRALIFYFIERFVLFG